MKKDNKKCSDRKIVELVKNAFPEINFVIYDDDGNVVYLDKSRIKKIGNIKII